MKGQKKRACDEHQRKYSWQVIILFRGCRNGWRAQRFRSVDTGHQPTSEVSKTSSIMWKTSTTASD
ncbi:MAG TPA: hypothetical protein VGC89_01170, partial [Pyrinomonadaceae bacterium]